MTDEETGKLNQWAQEFADINQNASTYDEAHDDLDELPPRPSKTIPTADRELLVLAARALGARFEEVDGEGYGNLHFDDGAVVHAWNSLAFSGDSFELGVRLGILELAAAEVCLPSNQVGDEFANMRLSVTRVAAEVGKTMAQ